MRWTVRLKREESDLEEEADLYDDVTVQDLVAAQSTWRPVLLESARALKRAGKPIPRYLHWDWRAKEGALGRLDAKFYAIRAQGNIQGLMKLDLGTLHRCRLEPQVGKELVYVDYVETAPWNIAYYMHALGFRSIYGRVGLRLLQAAVQCSLDGELKGRVGLHSLSDAEGFYRKVGMSESAPDVDKQNLRWFEFTPESAQSCLEKYR